MGLAALDVGARVEIHGLKKSPELNGQRGEIIGLLENSKYEVRLDQARARTPGGLTPCRPRATTAAERCPRARPPLLPTQVGEGQTAKIARGLKAERLSVLAAEQAPDDNGNKRPAAAAASGSGDSKRTRI